MGDVLAGRIAGGVNALAASERLDLSPVLALLHGCSQARHVHFVCFAAIILTAPNPRHADLHCRQFALQI